MKRAVTTLFDSFCDSSGFSTVSDRAHDKNKLRKPLLDG